MIGKAVTRLNELGMGGERLGDLDLSGVVD